VAAWLAWIVAALSVAMFVASAGLTALSLYDRSDAPGAQEAVRRPWWRRMFGS
jgi:hypothetical protein